MKSRISERAKPVAILNVSLHPNMEMHQRDLLLILQRHKTPQSSTPPHPRLLGSRLPSIVPLLPEPLCCGTAFPPSNPPLAELSLLLGSPTETTECLLPPPPAPSPPPEPTNLSKAISYGFLARVQCASYSSSCSATSMAICSCGVKGTCRMESEGGGGG